MHALPTTSDQIPDEWIDMVQEIIHREGRAIRPGQRPTIEVKSLHDNQWRPLMLFGSGTEFINAAERDAVLARLEGR